MNIDKEAAIGAAAVCVGIVGLAVLLAWSLGPGPDWIWQAIIGVAALAAVYYAVYVLISTR